jgi:predicted DsbA family dithiol-disulfide isomerase
MMKAISEKRYRSVLDQAHKEGRKINLTGVPTFIINEKHKIVGAQPVEVFSASTAIGKRIDDLRIITYAYLTIDF